jgi:roadblock/LC7 domain-containing protein
MNPNDMDQAVRLAALNKSLQQYSAQAVQQAQQATSALQRTVQEAADSAQRITAEALEQFRRTASSAATEGLRYPLEETSKTLNNGAARIESAMASLDVHMKTQRKMFAAYAWKTFIASAAASLAVIGVAVYMAARAHQDITRTEWIGAINAAIANGKLAACPEGGVCAYVGKKPVRLWINRTWPESGTGSGSSHADTDPMQRLLASGACCLRVTKTGRAVCGCSGPCRARRG